MRLYIISFLIIILIVIAFIFGSQNDQEVVLNYLIAKMEITVAAAVSLFTVIGFLLGLLTVMFWKLLKPFKRNKKINN